MRITGLCGGIGAGKSTVAELLAGHGAHVIDVDAIGRRVLAVDGSAYDAVVAAFGPPILAADRSIDRAALAAIVFADPDQLARLESISHPAIDTELDVALAALPDRTWVVLDMAVLAESELGRNLASGRGYDTVVVVEAPLETRIRRLVEQRGMTAADARSRIEAQASDDYRRALADIVIVNDAGRAELAAKVAAVVPDLSVQP